MARRQLIRTGIIGMGAVVAVVLRPKSPSWLIR